MIDKTTQAKNNIQNKQHYKGKGKDPRRTQRGQNHVHPPPFYDTHCIYDDRELANVVLVIFICITAFRSENAFLRKNRGVHQNI